MGHSKSDTPFPDRPLVLRQAMQEAVHIMMENIQKEIILIGGGGESKTESGNQSFLEKMHF